MAKGLESWDWYMWLLAAEAEETELKDELDFAVSNEPNPIEFELLLLWLCVLILEALSFLW